MNEITISVGGNDETYIWYDDELPSTYSETGAPMNVTDYADYLNDPVNFNASAAGMFPCDVNANSVTVSYTYSSTVSSSDAILIWIYNNLEQNDFWFMLGNFEVRCLGLYFEQNCIEIIATMGHAICFSITT